MTCSWPAFHRARPCRWVEAHFRGTRAQSLHGSPVPPADRYRRPRRGCSRIHRNRQGDLPRLGRDRGSQRMPRGQEPEPADSESGMKPALPDQACLQCADARDGRRYACWIVDGDPWCWSFFSSHFHQLTNWTLLPLPGAHFLWAHSHRRANGSRSPRRGERFPSATCRTPGEQGAARRPENQHRPP